MLSDVQRGWGRVLGVLAAWSVLLLGVAPLHAEVSYPPRIGQREFVLDGASLLTPAQKQALVARCDTTLTQTGVPIVVVTITSLQQYGAGGWTIERYATNLYDAWQIGSMVDHAGVLLLISQGDRKLRIELGKGYRRDLDQESQRIMDTILVPAFRKGQFGDGITRGVDALAQMVARAGTVAPAALGGSNAANSGATTPPATSPAPTVLPPRAAPASGGAMPGLGLLSGTALSCSVLPFFAAFLVAMLARGIFRGGRSTTYPWWYMGSAGSGASSGSWGGGSFGGGGGFGGGSFGGGSSGGGGASGGW